MTAGRRELDRLSSRKWGTIRTARKGTHLSRENTRDRDPLRERKYLEHSTRSTRAGFRASLTPSTIEFHTSLNVAVFNRLQPPASRYQVEHLLLNLYRVIIPFTLQHRSLCDFFFFFLLREEEEPEIARVRERPSRLAYYKERLANGSQLRTTSRFLSLSLFQERERERGSWQ